MSNDDYLDLEKVASGETPVPAGLPISKCDDDPSWAGHINLDDAGRTVHLGEFVYEHRGFLIVYMYNSCWMICDPVTLPGWERSWVVNTVHDNCSSVAEARRAIDLLWALARRAGEVEVGPPQ
jgi:hypothetical protein